VSSSEAPPDVAVRAASSSDLDFLSEANRLAQDAVTDARGGTLANQLLGRREPLAETFNVDLASSTTAVRLGTLDGHGVGYLVVRKLDLPNGSVVAEIGDLWVHPDARGVGVGAALMQEALAIAQDWGASGVDSRALPGDRVTKNFFESFGLKARLISVHRSLNSGAAQS